MRQDKFTLFIISFLILIHVAAIFLNLLYVKSALIGVGFTVSDHLSLEQYASPIIVTTISSVVALLVWMDGRCYNIKMTRVDGAGEKSIDENQDYYIIKCPAIFWICSLVLVYAIVFILPSLWACLSTNAEASRSILGIDMEKFPNLLYDDTAEIQKPLNALQKYYTWVESIFSPAIIWIWKTFLGQEPPKSTV